MRNIFINLQNPVFLFVINKKIRFGHYENLFLSS